MRVMQLNLQNTTPQKTERGGGGFPFVPDNAVDVILRFNRRGIAL